MRKVRTMSRNALVIALLTTSCASYAATGDAASAGGQASADPAPSEGLGEITVTARKREESSLKIPVAITAFSSKTLDAMNVQSVEQLARITPGMAMNNIAAGQNRSDRSRQSIIIRGMAPSSGSDTTSVFINGVPIDAAAFSGVFDFERVEILKGPQSAYFGRQTFAGAANIVLKEPTDEFEGYVSALGGTRNYADIKGAVGGPLIPGILSFRATGRYFTRDGSWTNEAEPGNTLGDQSTRSGSLQFKFTPTESLTIKIFGLVSKDDDGAGATSSIQASQSNCVLPKAPYFCGTLPGLLPGEPSAHTAMNPGIVGLIQGYTPLMSNEEKVDHFGFRRDIRTFTGNIDYELPSGIIISSLSGYNENDWSTLYQQTAYASRTPNTFTSGGVAQQFTDWPLTIQHKGFNLSQEFRIASAQDQALRWIVGGAFLHNKAHEAYAQLYYFSGLGGAYSPTRESRTWSGFFGLAYDLSDQITLNVDGRYQADTLISRDGETDAIGYQATYKTFTPRVSLQYKVTPDVMVYATYSKGVNPGLGLNPLLAVPTQFVETLRSMGVSEGVRPEYLDNYEIGVKGKFFDNRLIISADVYFDVWKDKIVESTILIPRAGDTPLFVNAYTNLGKVNLPGGEIDITAMPFDNLVINVSGAINDSKIKSGDCDACSRQTGSPNAYNNQLSYTPKYSAQGWVEYSADFVPVSGFKWFGRVEGSYKSGIYESDGNYAKTPSSKEVNFRAGVRSSAISIEAFVTNAFNNKAYTSARPGWNLADPATDFGAYRSVTVGLPDLRTFGVRARYDF